ncbi:16S rRNA (guanine(527)-N(7))-methyltransferase RsmG [Chitinophaga sp. SYP-B3965]|uniref:16S rRNA (guanine(527)-N(7))-methyltransferase RsmG n=1 Tax=Chitinophaga sp. SYP-B3965 TaxID=2663120 RepID=UPI0012997146|nr:16S rRNA (guanine(527)-N(7))-methyltransferase RsmG [Chitinophaga sp. SYP-B3965]MRG48186.1 16S rRNA (guanine(527)-N(7))-methyltransferase RsmG [Chitinophaga sp. SYP-B3965]
MEIILKYFSDFTPKQMDQFQALAPLYKEWNEKINVISRKDIDALYEKHILHSLAIAAVTELPDGLQVLDLGTGGGFPGIPLAIFFPEVKFHLVDSIGKKIKVVEAVAEALNLTNVTTAHSRAEEVKNRKFDLVVSRAVAPLKDLLHWSKPLIRKGASEDKPSGLICLKGGDLAQEVSESGSRPKMVNIYKIFPEEYFQEKYVIAVR